VYSRWEFFDFPCAWMPKARLIDTFDSDIIVDIEAHQSCLQICRGEGDITLHKLAGGDVSDESNLYVMADVPHLFDVFSEMTFDIAKMNLKGAKSRTLGSRMGGQKCSHSKYFCVN
jgi:hypothetical protein